MSRALAPFGPLLIDPVLRTTALLMVLFGGIICSFGPYVSVLAVGQFGLGDRGFAALMVVSTLLSVGASVYAGIRADQTASRRRIAIQSMALLLAACALMTLAPGMPAFVLAHGVLIPLSSSFFGQLFALARLAASTHPRAERDGILSTIRALFALPFVVVLPLWSVAFSQGATLLALYPVCLLMAAVMVLVMLRHWPKDGATAWADPPSGLRFGAALAEMARPALAGRVLALGAVNCASTIYIAVIGLLLTANVGRGPQDVALYVGLVAGAEVPFMLALPTLTRGQSRPRLILIGTAIYCIHVALLPLLAGSVWLWALILPAAMGGAIILTVPIAYLQDLLHDRPGTGSSLMALQRVVGDTLAALCFALGTMLSGYGLVAALGTGVALFGGLALMIADRRR